VRSARFFLFLIACSAVIRADALTDLRATLGQLTATTAVHGSVEATSTMSNNEEQQPDNGRATFGFDVSDAGLRILYPRGLLTQAAAEARGEAIDPERATPARSGLRRVRPLHIAELLDAAAALNVILESAQFVETKPASYRGKPSRLVMFKLTPKVSKATSKHLKKLEGSLSVWLGDDGAPIAAERSIYFKASFLLISFENTQKQSWSYMRSGDRLVAMRYEESEKSDGFGQHNTSQTTEVVKIE
jgi:hypothetical protein